MATISSQKSVFAEVGSARENLVMANNVTAGDDQEATDKKNCKKMEIAREKYSFRAVHVLSKQTSPEPTTYEMTIDSTEDSLAGTTNADSFKAIRRVSEEVPTQSTVMAGLETITSPRSEREHGQVVIAEELLVPGEHEVAVEAGPGIPDDSPGDLVGSESTSTSSGLKSMTHGAKDRTSCPFLGVNVDIRCGIYELFNPFVNKTIHLTYSPKTTIFENSWPAHYKLSKDMSNLLASCRKVHEELTGLIYGANTFVFMPGQQNYNSARMPDPCSMTEIWFPHLCPNTRQQFRKLRIFLDFSLQAGLNNIADLLADFPDVEITVHAPSAFKEPIRQSQCATLKRTCRAIYDARTNAYRTAWHDAGSTDVARMLEDSLPAGFQTSQSPQHHT